MEEYIRIIPIPQIEHVVSIEYEMNPGIRDEIFGQIFENCISAIQQCPFQGLSSINYFDAKEGFARISWMLHVVKPEEKNLTILDVVEHQEYLSKDLNLNRIWKKYAKTDELPHITWAKIDQNNELAVEDFLQDYKIKIDQVFQGFKECIFRALVLSRTIRKLKQCVEYLGLWDKLKVHYNQADVPIGGLGWSYGMDFKPQVSLGRLKAKLLEKSETLIEADWINGDWAQLMEIVGLDGRLHRLDLFLDWDIRTCVYLLRHGVLFKRGKFEPLLIPELSPFETFFVKLIVKMIDWTWNDEETKQLIQSCKEKFKELENFNYEGLSDISAKIRVFRSQEFQG